MTEPDSYCRDKGWLLHLIVTVPVVALVFSIAFVLLSPHTSLKSGPRIQHLNALRRLGTEIMVWKSEANRELPNRIDDLGSSVLSKLGSLTNDFVYLGSKGSQYGVVAVERINALSQSRKHWTSGRLAVLKNDFSVDMVLTNTLPNELINVALGNNAQF